MQLNKELNMERNFKLQNNEEIILISRDIKVKANDNEFFLTLFLTTERLVLLKDVSKELDYNAFLRARAASIPSNDEVIFDLPLKEIKDSYFKEDVNYLTLKDNNVLALYCENITKYIK